MFMLTFSLLLLVLLFTSIYLFDKYKGIWEVPAIILTGTSVIWFVIFIVMGIPIVYLGHISDVEGIEYELQVVTIEEDRLERLYNRLESFQYNPDGISMWNDDTPVHSTTEAINIAESRIASAQRRVESHKRRIRERSRWIYNWIVDIVPSNY